MRWFQVVKTSRDLYQDKSKHQFLKPSPQGRHLKGHLLENHIFNRHDTARWFRPPRTKPDLLRGRTSAVPLLAETQRPGLKRISDPLARRPGRGETLGQDARLRLTLSCVPTSDDMPRLYHLGSCANRGH